MLLHIVLQYIYSIKLIRREVSNMATISITTDYKFTKKSAEKLLNAMDRNEQTNKVNKTNVSAAKVKSKEEMNSILKDFNNK